jgi:DNA-binding transcriptional ArsR family regulator
MPRGRPTKSQIRQNIVEILHYMGEGYGYEISKIYNEIFSPVTQRSVYYHLKKGIQTKEIRLHKIEVERGDFTWGSLVEKVYYTLGKQANPQGEIRVKHYLEKRTVKKATKKPFLKKVFTK